MNIGRSNMRKRIKSINMMESVVFIRTAIYYTFLLRTVCPGEITCSNNCYCDEAVEYVSCIGDGVWDILPNVPRTAVRLELRNYVIPSLSSGQLHGFTGLHELKLQQTQTRYVENGTFSNLSYLSRLELSQNLITNLTISTFEGLQRLRYLDMSSNLLVGIDESFLMLSNVEQLNLHANSITQVTSHSFYGLQKVQYLNLDSNHISYIEVGSFQYLTNLAHLILSNNPLTSLSRLDFFGSRLQYIDISNLGLERVPQSLTKFVRDLRLAKNNLTRISAGDFDSYPYLGLLVLDDNLISEIEPDALGRQEYLVRLWLNGNSLAHVPENFPPSLQALYMEENDLRDIRNYSFKGLVNLEQLFLQRNKIQRLLECAFCDLVSLKSLDLQANQIERLVDGAFSNLSALEFLDLSQNSIKIMDPLCFEGLGNMKTLQLSRISTPVVLDVSLFDPLRNLQMLEIYDSPDLSLKIINSSRLLHGLRNLRSLNIMHNRLFNLRSDFPSFFPNLKVIKMNGNNWHCNRNIMWLVRWIQQSSLQFYRTHSIQCDSPPNLQFKPIMMLTEEEVSSHSFTENVTTKQPSTLQVILNSFPERHPRINSSDVTRHDHSISSGTQMSIGGIDLQELFNFTNEASETIEHNATTEIVASQYGGVLVQSSEVQESHEFKQDKKILSLVADETSSASSAHGLDHVTAVIIVTSIVSATLVLVISVVLSVLFYNYHCRYRTGGNHCLLRRSSSISYYPQRDEISIVTVSESTGELQTKMHHSLGNKLYYIMENGDVIRDPIKDEFAEPHLQELLAKTTNSNQCGLLG